MKNSDKDAIKIFILQESRTNKLGWEVTYSKM